MRKAFNRVFGKIKITLPSNEKIQFVLLGTGYDLINFSNILLEEKFKKPIIVTHSKKFHARDNRLLKNYGREIDIFSYAKKKKLQLIEEDNVNSPELTKTLLDFGSNVVFSHACRSIIKKDFLKSFKNLVFNIHPSYLPEERGAATYSWRILNDQKFVAATIHQIDEGIDTGHILFQKKIHDQKKQLLTSSDYDVATTAVYEYLFKKFLKKICGNEKINVRKQDEDKSSYLPRLYTEINGAINFHWNSNEIERFVRAFSYPYPGAFTFIRKQKIFILECFVEKTMKKFHPFVGGRVNKIFSDGTVRVITKDGFLRIKKIRIKKQIINPSKFVRINDVFFTPNTFLEMSKMQTISTKKMK